MHSNLKRTGRIMSSDIIEPLMSLFPCKWDRIVLVLACVRPTLLSNVPEVVPHMHSRFLHCGQALISNDRHSTLPNVFIAHDAGISSNSHSHPSTKTRMNSSSSKPMMQIQCRGTPLNLRMKKRFIGQATSQTSSVGSSCHVAHDQSSFEHSSQVSLLGAYAICDCYPRDQTTTSMDD
jgi:hypothetical protein